MSKSCAGYISAPLPPDETERLLALRRYGLLDAAPEMRFDRISSLTRRLMGTSMAMVSLVDANRQFLMSEIGMGGRETPRSPAFCAHTILADTMMEVPDAAEDPRFAGNPLVIGPPYIRYYAGIPLRTRDGFRIGTLCALDTVPRAPLTPDQRAVMADLAATTMEVIEARAWALEAEAEHELARQTVALKDQYLASMAHELRTPVNAMNGFGELLRMTGAAELMTDSQRDYLDSIIEASGYMALLINETLETQASMHTADPGPARPVPLAPVLTSVGRLIAPLARKQSVTLALPDDTGVSVWGDPLRLRQVFINLLSNAVKYNRKGGSVTVDVSVDGGQVAVACRDTGPGIPAAEIPKLFDAYHRVAGSSEVAEGTGLGLHITDRLVRTMGGTVTVDSTEGVGTTFTVTLEQA